VGGWSMSESTVVLSTGGVGMGGIPAFYDAQLSRMHTLDDAEPDTWCLVESRMPDVVGLPAKRWAHLWRLADSAVEAFQLGKPLLEEVAMFGFSLTITETGVGNWVLTLMARER
jgi:hypothetical protein